MLEVELGTSREINFLFLPLLFITTIQSRSQFSKDGGGHPGRRGVTATPKLYESFIGSPRKWRSLRGFDHEFFYCHPLYVGYNVTNVLCNTIKAGKGVWGFVRCLSYNDGKCPFASFLNCIQGHLKNHFGWRL